MKTEVTIVAKDQCPLNVLAELGNRTQGAWIFLHHSVVNKLRSMPYDLFERSYGNIKLTWNATEDFPKTSITIRISSISSWKPVYEIEAEDIAFKYPNFANPEEIFFLQMEE